MNTETQISPHNVPIVTCSDDANWVRIDWLKRLRDKQPDSSYAAGFFEIRDGSKCLKRYMQLAPYDAELFVAQVRSLHSKRCEVRVTEEGAEFIEALVDCTLEPSGVCT